jgi:hypothetical protein
MALTPSFIHACLDGRSVPQENQDVIHRPSRALDHGLAGQDSKAADAACQERIVVHGRGSYAEQGDRWMTDEQVIRLPVVGPERWRIVVRLAFTAS